MCLNLAFSDAQISTPTSHTCLLSPSLEALTLQTGLQG